MIENGKDTYLLNTRVANLCLKSSSEHQLESIGRFYNNGLSARMSWT